MEQAVIEGSRVGLLRALKLRQADAWSDLLMPTKPQKTVASTLRVPEIYTGRMPDRKSETEKAPYVLNTVVNSVFKQEPGQLPVSAVTIRSTFCVYNDDGEEGALMLLNMMERLRISLLREPILENVYEMILDGDGLQDLVYPDDTAPFYMADMITEWKIPPVKREDWKVWLK